MRPKIREILEECIERGVEDGYLKAHKHDENPRAFHIYEQIESAIWYEIDQRFEFERNVCNEVVEGFDHLEEKRSHEQFLEDLNDWAEPDEREWVGLTREEEAVIIEQWRMDEGRPSQLCRMIEAKLKEKNA